MKQTIGIGIVFILICMLIMAMLSYVQYQMYRNTLNSYIAQTIEMVIALNPEIEVELIQELQKNDSIEKGKEILAKYGFQGQEVYFFPLEEQMEKNRLVNIGVMGALGVSILGLFIVYICKRDKKLEEIRIYLKNIQNKDYSLEIKDNSEGELSLLRNEVYKITVMLKEQTENLQKEKKLLSDSLSDISHQLKTPLTSISVMLDILKEDKNISTEKKQEFLFEISRQLESMNWLVIALLKLSRLDAGVVEFKKEKVLIMKLVEEVIKNLSIPIEIKNQNVTKEGEETASFEGDFRWTVEAITNIVKNCIEHTEEGKTVDISWNENPLYTELLIKDEGQGIAKEDISHIFERFYKGKNSSKDSVGIGLALAKSIIQKQNGDIMVKSVEGQGSRFSIKFYKR